MGPSFRTLPPFCDGKSAETMRQSRGYLPRRNLSTIATGWSDPCRVGLSPNGKPRLYAAHEKDGLAMARKTASAT
jgi:hypothetical protein